MKRLATVVIILTVLAVFLIVLAFLYIDLSGHREFRYDLLVGGTPAGTVKIDRYVTEDKVVYKSNAEYPYSTGYPVVSEKLFLKKRTMIPTKFIEEAYGSGGQRRVTLLLQDGEETDFLFLEYPKFITLKGFETGKRTMVFSPDDIVLYMPIMKKYNFWKKGTQFFEVMIPVDETMPPMRDKIEIRYIEDTEIPVMGHRVEAESFAVKGRSTPEARVFLSKYTHRILALEIEAKKVRFVLVGFTEDPGERIRSILDKFTSIIKSFRPGSGEPSVKGADGSGKESLLEPAGAVSLPKRSTQEKIAIGDVFFESDNLILSGKVRFPETKGENPAVVIVPKDGPMTKGEQGLIDSLGEFLSNSGFVVLTFDGPGQGKSQGSCIGTDEAKRVRNITAAVSYLSKLPGVMDGSVSLIGHEGGGYLALKAARESSSVRACILLAAPIGLKKTDISQNASEQNIQRFLKEKGLGPFDQSFMDTIAKKMRENIDSVTRSTEDTSFFMGVKLPVKEYREYMSRDPQEAVMSFSGPVMLAFGKDSRYFDTKIVDEARKLFSREKRSVKISIFKDPGRYMGAMERSDGSWHFSPNKDVLIIIGNWLAENGISEKKEESGAGSFPDSSDNIDVTG